MSGHTEDKPKDCRYCYFWKQTEGCTYRGKPGCYYISAQKPPAAVSECDGCPYGRASPCIAWCTKELMRSSDVPNGTFHSECRFLKIESQRKLTVP